MYQHNSISPFFGNRVLIYDLCFTECDCIFYIHKYSSATKCSYGLEVECFGMCMVRAARVRNRRSQYMQKKGSSWSCRAKCKRWSSRSRTCGKYRSYTSLNTISRNQQINNTIILSLEQTAFFMYNTYKGINKQYLHKAQRTLNSEVLHVLNVFHQVSTSLKC